MFRSAGQFSLLLQPSDAVLCQTKMFSFSGKGDTGAGRGDVVNDLCNIAQHETLPRRTRKACERNKQETLLGVLGFCLCFFFSMGQITVGRFNGHYYVRKKAEGDSMPDVVSPSVVSLCVLQSLECRLY